MNTVESFAAVLFYERGDGERVQIARVDNTEHSDSEGRDEIHIDRLYREADADRRDHDIAVEGVFEADAYLSERWQQFATQYETTHGE